MTLATRLWGPLPDGFPLSGICIIVDRDGRQSPYIKIDGALWFLHHQPGRVVRSIASERHMSAFDNERGVAIYHCRIEFADGSFYEAEGSAQFGAERGNQPRHIINEMAETRATRRAIVKATALTFIEPQEGHERD